MERSSLFFEKYSALITSAIIFVLYQFTIAPSVVQIDSGELATVQTLGGIAHPTGYPLFTIIGYLFLLLPLPFSKIFMSNFLSLIWCTIAVYYFVKTLQIIFRNICKDENNHLANVTSIFGGLFLGLSKTFWFQSTSVEVYSLHLLLLILIIFNLMKIFFTGEQPTNKIWLATAVILALAFSNHMTTILLIPTIALVYYWDKGIKQDSFILLGKMLLIFFPILLLLYSYLPLRALQGPTLNWGNPINIENFFRHVSGAQYQTWIFSSFESAKKQFYYFINNMPSEFTFSGIIMIVFGFIFAFKKNVKLASMILLLALTTIGYSINYDIVDIDSYFLLAFISFSIFAALSFWKLTDILSNRLKINFAIILLLPFLIYPGIKNFNQVSQNNNYIFEDYTKAILSSVDSNSVIFSYQWDYFLASSYYFQHVEQFRSDVTVIDKELLRRSWYYDQMKNNYPDVIAGQSDNINHFLNALRPFERGKNFNPQLLEKYYQSIMTGFVSDNLKKRSYYIGIELLQNEMRNGSFKLPEGCSIVPYNLLFKVIESNDYVPAPVFDLKMRFGNIDNNYTRFIKTTIYNMLTYRGLYELSFHKSDQAALYAKKIKSLFPRRELHKNLAGLIN